MAGSFNAATIKPTGRSRTYPSVKSLMPKRYRARLMISGSVGLRIPLKGPINFGCLRGSKAFDYRASFRTVGLEAFGADLSTIIISPSA